MDPAAPPPEPGAPEAVLDWGGGGQRTKGAHDFSVRGLISGVASFLVWGGGKGTK